MTEQQKNAEISTSSPKPKRSAFPRLSLKKVIDLPNKLYELSQGEPYRRVKLFDSLGKSPDSGTSRMMVTVSSLYGLTKGGYQAEYIELTKIGEQIASSEKGSKQLYENIYEVLFSNEIFSEFIEYWKDKSPNEELATDWLQRTFGLNIEDAKTCWFVFKENIDEYGLTEVLSGKNVILSRDTALNNFKYSNDNENTKSEVQTNKDTLQFVDQTFDEDSNKPYSPSLKPFGTQVIERNFSTGRVRLILPESMLTKEKELLISIIEASIAEEN